VIAGVFVTMLLAEAMRPLRARIEPKLRHTIRNLSTGGISLAVMTLLQAPLLVPVAKWAEHHDVGIVPRNDRRCVVRTLEHLVHPFELPASRSCGACPGIEFEKE